MKSECSLKVSVVSLGCPKNLVDTERMLAILAQAGCVVGAPLEDCDVALINTCGFLASACQEALDVIEEACKLKDAGMVGRIVVTGCLPSRAGGGLMQELSGVDAIVGVNDRDRILKAVLSEKRVTMCSTTPAGVKDEGRFRLTPRHTAYLRLAEGCSQRCTFCTIPAIRGPFRSKRPSQVMREARELVADGAGELNLIAQDTTAYGADLGDVDLADIIRKLGKIENLRWIRLMYTYPMRFSDKLIETIATTDKVVPYVDIPLQHISDPILKRMGRRSTRAQVETLLEKLRLSIPNVTIRTAFIVGFPGEEEAHFEELLKFVKDFRFDALGVFEYSPEHGTSAARMKNQVSDDEKHRRAKEIMRLQRRIAFAANRRRVGERIEVVVDGKDPEDRCFARHAGQAPEIDGVCLLTKRRQTGQWLTGEVVGSQGYDLVVEPVTSQRR